MESSRLSERRDVNLNRRRIGEYITSLDFQGLAEWASAMINWTCAAGTLGIVAETVPLLNSLPPGKRDYCLTCLLARCDEQAEVQLGVELLGELQSSWNLTTFGSTLVNRQLLLSKHCYSWFQGSKLVGLPVDMEDADPEYREQMVKFYRWAVRISRNRDAEFKLDPTYQSIKVAKRRLLRFLDGSPEIPGLPDDGDSARRFQSLEHKAWLQTFIKPWQAVAETVSCIPDGSHNRSQALAACLSEYCGLDAEDAVNGLLQMFPGSNGLAEAFKWLLERGRLQEAEALIDEDAPPCHKLRSYLALYRRRPTSEKHSEILASIEECRLAGFAQHLWGYLALVEEGFDGEFDLNPLDLLKSWNAGWPMLSEDCYNCTRLDVLAELHRELPDEHTLSPELATSYLLRDPGFCLEFGEQLEARKPVS